MRFHLLSHRTAACFFSGLLTLLGCAGAHHPHGRPSASLQGVEGRFYAGQIIHLESGRVLDFTQFIDRIAGHEAVFLGEVHDNPDHHLIQVQILQSLMERHGRLTAAMEFFQEQQQSDLDDYLSGVSDEEGFLRAVDWPRTWGFDYRLYRPLMLLLKQGGAKVLAINAPSEIVRKVARSGLQGLDPQERGRLAQRIRLDDQAHRDYLLETYRLHTHPDLKVFEHFYEAQCAWEDTMAENVANYLRTHREKVVVLSGNGHIVYRFGLPERTLDRVRISSATVLLHPLDEPVTLSPDMADYVWLTADCRAGIPPLVPSGRRPMGEPGAGRSGVLGPRGDGRS